MEAEINDWRVGFRGEEDEKVVVAIVRHLWGNKEGEEEESKEEQDDMRRRPRNRCRRYRAIVIRLITMVSGDRGDEEAGDVLRFLTHYMYRIER